MVKKTYRLETISCPGCAAKIEKMLKKTDGIIEAEVLYNTSRVKVSFDGNVTDSDEIKNRIGKLGYKVIGER